MTAREPVPNSSPSSSTPRVLNVGILGLGARWQTRYAQALRSLNGHFHVRAVADAIQDRADHEARALGCSAAAGPTELLEHPDVDVLFLLEAAWYGLWPVEQACRVGKPVLCAVPLEQDEHAARLVQQVQERNLVLMMEMLLPLEQMTQRLKPLLAGPLGPARLVLCDWAQSGAGSAPPLAALLDWCAELLGTVPVSTLATVAPEARLASTLLEFPQGRAVHVLHRPGPQRGRLRVEVVTAHGKIHVDGTRHLRWSDADGRHTVVLPRGRQALPQLLERFYQVVTGAAVAPSLQWAERSLRWLRAVTRSQAEGRKVSIEPL
jgi:predicted dehydrogenase